MSIDDFISTIRLMTRNDGPTGNCKTSATYLGQLLSYTEKLIFHDGIGNLPWPQLVLKKPSRAADTEWLCKQWVCVLATQ